MTYHLVLLLVLLFTAHRASAQSNPTSPWYFPTANQWEIVSHDVAGADREQLERALQYAGEKNSKGVVVLWRGRLLAERYWDGCTRATRHPAYSVSKSLVSTLVGMAIEEKKIAGTGQSAAVFLQEWQGKPKYEAITIGHMLSMTSGLQGGKRNFLRGALSRDERALATSLPLEFTPGTHWDYQNSVYRLFFSLLPVATGESLPKYTTRKLLDPLDMKHTQWQTKRLSRDQYTFLSTTPRDAARFGLLILAGGNWNGQQLINRQWLQRATTAANPRVNPSYGYLWWLNGGDRHYLPLHPVARRGPIFPGCPADAFAALGKDDQKIYVVPSLQIVVTRFGDAADATSPAISQFDAKFLGRICDSFKSASR